MSSHPQTSPALPVVVMISGNGSNLQAVIDAIHNGTIAAEIKLVISNQADAFGLERARKAGIPTLVIDQKDHENRRSFDSTMMRYIDHYPGALVVLAGFMRILSDEFVEHYSGRMLNIHPSLLPKYKGLNTHARVLEDGGTEHGASVHFVTPTLDDGPVIAQAKIAIRPNDTPDSLKSRVHQIEHVIYPTVIGWYAENKIRMDSKNNTVLWNEKPITDKQRLLDIPVD